MLDYDAFRARAGRGTRAAGRYLGVGISHLRRADRRRATASTAPRARRSASSRRARSTCTSPAARPATASRPPSCSSPPTRSASTSTTSHTIQGDTAVTAVRRRHRREPQRLDDRRRGAARPPRSCASASSPSPRTGSRRPPRTSSSPTAGRTCAARRRPGVSLAEIAAIAYFDAARLPPGMPAGLEASAPVHGARRRRSGRTRRTCAPARSTSPPAR